jgi:hypothetical protein
MHRYGIDVLATGKLNVASIVTLSIGYQVRSTVMNPNVILHDFYPPFVILYFQQSSRLKPIREELNTLLP